MLAWVISNSSPITSNRISWKLVESDDPICSTRLVLRLLQIGLVGNFDASMLMPFWRVAVLRLLQIGLVGNASEEELEPEEAPAGSPITSNRISWKLVTISQKKSDEDSVLRLLQIGLVGNLYCRLPPSEPSSQSSPITSNRISWKLPVFLWQI